MPSATSEAMKIELDIQTMRRMVGFCPPSSRVRQSATTNTHPPITNERTQMIDVF